MKPNPVVVVFGVIAISVACVVLGFIASDKLGTNPDTRGSSEMIPIIHNWETSLDGIGRTGFTAFCVVCVTCAIYVLSPNKKVLTFILAFMVAIVLYAIFNKPLEGFFQYIFSL